MKADCLPLHAVVSVDSLVPYAANARTHSAEQVALIAASIQEFGFTNPVLVDGAGGIIAGHGRVLAARKLGLPSVPVIRLDYLSDEEKRAYVLADNKLALNASWDEALLKSELSDLMLAPIDVAVTGFSADELDGLFADAVDPSAALDAPFMVAPVSVLSARGGWWQSRKRAWLALGIQSELGRGGAAGLGAAVPGEGGASAIYRRGPGFKYENKAPAAHDPTLAHSVPVAGGRGVGMADALANRSRKANAIPGGGPMPLDRAKGRGRAVGK